MTVLQELPTVKIGKRTLTILFPDLVRPLTDRERQDLKNSIKANGVEVPIVVDERDGIIDGGNRAQIAAELGLPNVPTVVRKGLFLEDKRDLALRLNVNRRHLSASERDRLKKDRKARVKEARRQGKSLRSIAEQEGVSKSQIANDITELSTGGQLEEVSPPDGKVVGRDGKPRPAKRQADPILAAWRRRPSESASDWLARLQAVPQKLKDSRDLTFRKCLKSARDRLVLEDARERNNQTNSPPPDHAIEPPVAETETPGEITVLGKGLFYAGDAINALNRIPSNDALRWQGYRTVVQWIRQQTPSDQMDFVFSKK
jgi:ParB-like chromosome segregation protein Spo0J